MIYFCEKCFMASEEKQCHCCGRTNLRGVQQDDMCFVCEKPIIWGEMLVNALKDNGVPVNFTKRLGIGAAMKIGPTLDTIKIYVPYYYLEKSVHIVKSMFSDME